MTPSRGAPPALPGRAPTGSAPRTLVPSPRRRRCPDPSTHWRERLGCLQSCPRAGSLPACVQPGPALSVPPTAAPAAPQRRPRRSPRGCRPPLPPPSTPAFPVYSEGVTGPGGGGFPSPHLPAADARVIIAHLNKAATQVRGPAGAAPHAPARGGRGKGEGKANKAWSRGWSRAFCRTGATDVPKPLPPQRRDFSGRLLPAAARHRGLLAGPSQPPASLL